MLKILDQIEKIEKALNMNPLVDDFKLIVKLNNEIDVYAITDLKIDELICQIQLSENFGINFIPVDKTELKFDPLYQHIFSEDYPKIDLAQTWRFNSFFEEESFSKKDIKPKIVTFYSYKGGLGRTTTLCSYAMHLALNQGRKVIILDCDLEAPGYLNFFNLSGKSEKNGIVEFFMDYQFTNGRDININDYVIQIDDLFSSPGSIHMVPAGNLSYTEPLGQIDGTIMTHQDHYLQGLARLDFSRTHEVLKSFKVLFERLQEQFHLTNDDFILVDSRTGFNDIFGITALHLSDLVIGFFGSSEQSKPGLFFLLDEFEKRKINRPLENELGIILVNSIVPLVCKNEFYSRFNSILSEYSSLNENDSSYRTYCITRNIILDEIGVQNIRSVKDDNKRDDDIVKLIKHNIFSNKIIDDKGLKFIETTYSDYKDLFNGIDSFFEKKPILIDITTLDTNELRFLVIKSLKESLPNLFAEATEKINPETFYYRDCINLLFEREKFIIQGFKGTGKTYLYKSLRDEKLLTIRTNLLDRAGVNKKVEFIDIVSLRTDNILKKFPFDSQSINKIENMNNLWVSYFWSSIMVDIYLGRRTLLKDYKSLLENEIKEILSIKIDSKRINFFQILATDKIQQIEEDLFNLNTFLKDKSITLLLLFDQLDRLVNPNVEHLDNIQDFERVVSPLLNYWSERYNYEGYSNIQPKIFIRTDLFGKRVKGINNINLLKEYNTISLEWSPDEIYSFFFKLVLSNLNSKNAFFKICSIYNEYSKEFFSNVKSSLESNFNQIPLERNLIEPLLNTFFGKEINTETSRGLRNMGNPYDYFFKNLSNANGTISLRPFISMLNGIVEYAEKDNDPKPIINSVYTTKRIVRDRTAEEHLDDLVRESGKTIEIIIKSLKKDEAKEFRTIPLHNIELRKFLNQVIEESTILKGKFSADELIEIMEDNGIIREAIKPFGKVFYFAEMYKYWLNMRGVKNAFLDRDINKFKPSPPKKKQADLKLNNVYTGTIYSKLSKFGKGYGFIYVKEHDGVVYFQERDLINVNFDDLIENESKVSFTFVENYSGRKVGINITLS